ncbi:hypothetical protein BDB01DRAFT_894901 [Pilobolus umbonatus]|nr:hypothetical protein BDB01DRAFT_894901 [Pilobolus umbonatus]
MISLVVVQDAGNYKMYRSIDYSVALIETKLDPSTTPHSSIEFKVDRTYLIVGCTLGGTTLLLLLIGGIIALISLIQKRKERKKELQGWYSEDEEHQYMITKHNGTAHNMEEIPNSFNTLNTDTGHRSHNTHSVRVSLFDSNSSFSLAVKHAASIPDSPTPESPGQ